MSSDKSFQHLNLNNEWPGFRLDGLSNDGGTLRLQRASGSRYAECGTFLAGPIGIDRAETVWHRLQVMPAGLPQGTHVQFFSYSSDDMDGIGTNVPASPVLCTGASHVDNLLAAGNTPLNQWRSAPRDQCDYLILNQPGRYLWLSGILQGEGTSSPQIRQIRIRYNRESWLNHLPSVHQQDERNRFFLKRALALFEAMLADQEQLVEQLPRLFDPGAVPNQGAPDSWLDWLASTLAFPMDEKWSEGKRRSALANAFQLQSRRGTVESMRQSIKLYANATAHISEPQRRAQLWSLGQNSTLGFSTMLSPAHAQGAVVGTTATLDQSHLIEAEDFGSPLFEDIAHHFHVQVYAADVPDARSMEQVKMLVEREKPAHTTYHLGRIEANMRVGSQARIGIDSIVGHAGRAVVTGAARLGSGSILPAEEGLKIGKSVRIGYSKMIGEEDKDGGDE
jgi:phage tail-like protein